MPAAAMSSCLARLCFVLLFVVLVAPSPAASISLENEYVTLTFDNTSLALQSIHSNLHSPPYPLTSAPPNLDWWTATLVSNTSAYAISASSPHASSFARQRADALELQWRSIVVGDKSQRLTVDVAVTVALPADSPYAEFRYRVSATSGVLGLWSFTYSLSQLPSATSESDDDDMYVQNHSYGALFTKPLLSQPTGLTQQYPSNDGAYQFIAHYHVLNASAFPPTHAGLYVATHDPSAAYKLFRYEPDVSGGTLTLSVELRPPNNNLPLTARSGAQHSPFVVGCFRGDWWDASQLYRHWALREAPWARRSIRERGDSFPAVMKSAQVWINTGWQEHDVFNDTQGNPAVVLQRALSFAKRLGLQPQQLAMHWYVFQQSNKFDAFYPVYFPAKDGFTEAVAQLQDAGITVAPYVNGRIYDVDLAKWRDDDAQRFAAKSTPALLGFNLSLYYENYGNDVEQAAMCPYTHYWQQTYRNVSDTLVHTHGVHGIYVDQVGAAAAEPCYDPTHNHTLGDGTAWVEGYHTFLQGVLDAAGPTVAVVTESNAEPYMADLHGYLTLTAYQHSVSSRTGQLVPVFPAVYGGYMLGFGAIFTVADLVERTDSGYATLLAAQFVHGSQLGWMSLGGTQDEPPMGLYDLLMAPQYEAEMHWLTRLGTLRGWWSDYFLYGREMREPPFVVSIPADSIAPPIFLYSAWLLYNESAGLSYNLSLMLNAVTPSSTIGQQGVIVSIRMDPTDFGFPKLAHQQPGQWHMRRLNADGGSELVAAAEAGLGDGGGFIEYSTLMLSRSTLSLLVIHNPSHAAVVEQRGHHSEVA